MPLAALKRPQQVQQCLTQNLLPTGLTEQHWTQHALRSFLLHVLTVLVETVGADQCYDLKLTQQWEKPARGLCQWQLCQDVEQLRQGWSWGRGWRMVKKKFLLKLTSDGTEPGGSR